MEQINIYNFEDKLQIIEDIIKDNLLEKHMVYFSGDARYVPGLRFPVNITDYSNISEKKITNQPTLSIVSAMLVKDILLHNISIMNNYREEIIKNPFLDSSEPIYTQYEDDPYSAVYTKYLPFNVVTRDEQYSYNNVIYNEVKYEKIFLTEDEMKIIEEIISEIVEVVSLFILEAPDNIYDVCIESKYLKIIRKEHILIHRYEEIKRNAYG